MAPFLSETDPVTRSKFSCLSATPYKSRPPLSCARGGRTLEIWVVVVPISLLPQAQPGYDHQLIPALVRGRYSLIMEEHTMRPR